LLLPSGPDKVHGVLLRRTQTMRAEPSKGNFMLYDYIIFDISSQGNSLSRRAYFRG